jgi:suppressor of ftsI
VLGLHISGKCGGLTLIRHVAGLLLPSLNVHADHDEPNAPPRFIVTFTEEKSDFYINGEKFAPDAAPMLHAKVGTFQHWRIVNATKELHPMHIHQVHFFAYAENDKPIVDPLWLDTVNVPYGGSVDVIMDFTNPVIRGMSVFHCHLLNHEDKGMMAKIMFE